MIYTRKGDRGKTSLFDGRVVSKDSKVAAAIGALDELNSYLGVVRSGNKNKFINRELKIIQGNIFLMGAIIAGYKARFSKKEVKRIESRIDKLEAMLPPQQYFIFFAGAKTAAGLFYARSLARKAERSIVKLGKSANPLVLSYINRLSDYLFILGRYYNFKRGVKEEYWRSS